LGRLERRPGDDQERRTVLRVLATMEEGSQFKKEAIAALYRMLLDPAERSLHAPVLAALLRLWPHRAPEAKPALLRLIAAEPELFTSLLGLLYSWGVQVTRDELAALDAIYRRGCLSDDEERCAGESR